MDEIFLACEYITTLKSIPTDRSSRYDFIPSHWAYENNVAEVCIQSMGIFPTSSMLL